MALTICPFCKAKLYSKQAVQKHARMGRPYQAYAVGQQLNIGDVVATAFRAGTHDLRYKLASPYPGYSHWYDATEIGKLVKAMKHNVACTA